MSAGLIGIAEFDAATGLEGSGPDFGAALDGRWDTRQGPNGGFMLALATRAIGQVLPFPDPLVVSCFYLRPGSPGPTEIRTEVIRAGRTTGFGQASMYQDGKEVLRATAAFTDLAAAAARNPRSTWCVTITDQDGHAIGHGCARPATRRKPDGPGPPGGAGFTLTPTGPPGPPGRSGTWRFTTGQQDMLIQIQPLAGNCDHRWEARGHDPGVTLRHLTEVRYATCTGPGCRRPADRCDFEHNTPYEVGGRTCLCNGNPKCRHDHRLKQHPRWDAEQLPDGSVRWTTPSGRKYVTEPTRYPI